MNNIAVVILILVLATAGAGAAFYVMYFEPIKEEEKKIQDEIDQLKKKFAEIDKLDDEIDRLNREIADKQAEQKKLSTGNDEVETVVPKLLESTEKIANKYEVKFQDIRISPLVRNDQWSELPVELGISGTFANVGQFLVAMEKMKIVNLAEGKITISSSSEPDPKTKSPLLTVNLNAKVYIIGSS